MRVLLWPRCGEDGGHDARIPFPPIELAAEMFSALCRQAIELPLAICFGDPPLLVEEPAFLEAVEHGVQHAVAHEQGSIGGVADPAGDRVAVHRSPGNRFEDEEIERTSEEVGAGHSIPSHERVGIYIGQRGVPVKGVLPRALTDARNHSDGKQKATPNRRRPDRQNRLLSVGNRTPSPGNRLSHPGGPRAHFVWMVGIIRRAAKLVTHFARPEAIRLRAAVQAGKDMAYF